MKAIGIEKAARRLREAHNHATRLAEFEKGLNVPKFEYEWFQFLTAINSVFEVLGTTARKDAKSRQWWFSGPEKHVRKNDVLLRFLLHARGSDYHGLFCGTSPDVTGAEYLGYDDNPPISFTFVDESGEETIQKGGAIRLAGDATSFTFSYKLVPVEDEHHNTFPPPTREDGQVLKPSEAAVLALDYYGNLLTSAALRTGS